MRRVLLAATTAAGLVLVALEAQAEADSALAANGSCEFHAASDSNNCYHVTRYIRAEEGRTTFFIQALGTLSFTGTRLTTSLGRQALEVDGVSYGYNGGPPPEPATGTCEAALSADARTFLSVTCRAKTAAGAAYDFTFTSDGTPAYAVPTPRHHAPAAEAAALTALKSAADAGDLPAQIRLGVAYETADGAPEDLAFAARLFRIAAERGAPEAMRRLGDAHRFGLGVARDRREALRWYRLAADHGDAQAMFHLGEMIGENDADEDEAHDWYLRSAEAGFPAAMVKLAADAHDFAEPRRWLEKAIALNHVPAMRLLSRRLPRDGGLPGDTAEAERLTKLADIEEWDGRLVDAAAGDRTDMYLLGVAYNGDFVFPRDAVQAVRWFRMAAERGEGASMGRLADLFEKGDGIAKDPATAKAWRDRANAPDPEPKAAVADAKPQAPALRESDLATLPIDRLIAAAEHQHPVTYFFVAKRLMELGRLDEAVFWYYVGQVRWRAYLVKHPSEAQAFGALSETFREPLTEYIGGDLQAYVAIIDKVLAWDASHPDDFTKSRDARARSRAALVDLRQEIIARQDEIRDARSRHGLPNRNTAHVDQGAIPAPAQGERTVGGKTVAEVFQDAKVAALARAACAGNAATAVPQAVAADADPKTVGLLGATPLFWAFTCRNLTGMEALLKAGADPNFTYPGKGGASVVFSAAKLSDPAYLKLLLQYRGDPNAAEVDGSQTALMAAMEAAFQSLRWDNYYALLAAGADINQARGGTTVATMAAGRGQLDKVIELLDRGYSHDLEELGRWVELFSRSDDPNRAKVIARLEASGVHFPVPPYVERMKRKAAADGKEPGR